MRLYLPAELNSLIGKGPEALFACVEFIVVPADVPLRRVHIGNGVQQVSFYFLNTLGDGLDFLQVTLVGFFCFVDALATTTDVVLAGVDTAVDFHPLAFQFTEALFNLDRDCGEAGSFGVHVLDAGLLLVVLGLGGVDGFSERFVIALEQVVLVETEFGFYFLEL